ncbi:uncharacterized protein RBU33_024861 isoform 1-T1 [Hipposideros larvatus]
MEGLGGEGREEKSAPLRRGWRWPPRCAPRLCGRLIAGPAVPAPQNLSTNKHWRPRLPVPPPPGLCSLPAPTPLHGARGSGVLRAWARAPPPARLPPRSPPGRQPHASVANIVDLL